MATFIVGTFHTLHVLFLFGVDVDYHNFFPYDATQYTSWSVPYGLIKLVQFLGLYIRSW